MSHEKFDPGLLKAYRAVANEGPASGIDERLLRMADTHVSRQRRRRYWIPLAAAAALVLVAISSRHMDGTITAEARRAVADSVTAELLRLQPPLAAHSTVTEFLLDTSSRSISDAEVNDAR